MALRRTAIPATTAAAAATALLLLRLPPPLFSPSWAWSTATVGRKGSGRALPAGPHRLWVYPAPHNAFSGEQEAMQRVKKEHQAWVCVRSKLKQTDRQADRQADRNISE